MAIRLSSSSISSGGGGDANAGDGSDKRGGRKKKKKIPSYNYLMTLLVLVVSAIILLYASSSSVRNNNYTTNKDMIVFGSKAVMSSTISSSSDEPNNDDPSASLSPPYIDKHYCFIHIGKAAGSKVSCELGYRYTDCGKNYTPTYITTPTQFRARIIEKGLSSLAVLARDFTRVFFLPTSKVQVYPVHHPVPCFDR